jgi:hypothetical protein
MEMRNSNAHLSIYEIGDAPAFIIKGDASAFMIKGDTPAFMMGDMSAFVIKGDVSLAACVSFICTIRDAQ